MGSIFESGDAMVLAAFEYAARPIGYYRDEARLAQAIPAKLGRTLFRFEDASGMTVRTEQRDFIVRTTDLAIEPKNGDEIRFDGGIYLVTAPNDEPCWRWHSRVGHSMIRIHAKFAGPDEAGSSSSSGTSE